MKRENGFSIIEVMIVIIVSAIIAAIVVPSLLKSREASQEGVAKAKLSFIAASQSSYRTSMGKNRYATLTQLRNTVVAGSPLLSPADVDVSGNPILHDGWSLEQLEDPTDTTYGVGMSPVAGNGSKYRYAIFEDGVLRIAPKGSTISRSSNPL